MAIQVDMDKAKKKAAEEAAKAARQNFGPRPTWQPKPGKNRIRILPPWTDEGHNAFQWYRETYVHWNLGPEDEDRKSSVTCPMKTPPENISPCPVCEYVEQLRSSGDPANLEEAKRIKAKMAVYVNMIDLKDPTWTEENIEELQANNVPEDRLPEVGEPKVQVYRFGTMVFKDLLDYYTDDVDLVHLDEGFNIVITREGKPGDINTKYRVRTEPKPSRAPVPDDDPKVHNLDMMKPILNPQQIEAVMEGVEWEEVKKMGTAQTEASKGLPPGKEKKDDEESEEKAEPPKKAASKTTKKKPPGKKGNGKPEEPWPPVDDEGFVDFNKVTDEQIEDPNNANVLDQHGNPVHIQCYGGARQRDEDDSTCKDDCPLFERCGERIAALDAAEAKPKKRAPGGKKKKAAETSSAGDDEAAALEEEMAAHLED